MEGPGQRDPVLKASSSASRWNVVGIQGSLLSIFVEPIYFSSIILGSLYHGDHLSRAMYQRISNIEDLPALYTLNKPLLSGKYPRFLTAAGLTSNTPVGAALRRGGGMQCWAIQKGQRRRMGHLSGSLEVPLSCQLKTSPFTGKLEPRFGTRGLSSHQHSCC